jgi:hypothetical protein
MAVARPASSSFFLAGGTLGRDVSGYVSRRADDELFRGLSEGAFCYVLTSQQMGKSSLMVRTAARLRDAGTGVVVLDLTAIGQNLTAGDLMRKIEECDEALGERRGTGASHS